MQRHVVMYCCSHNVFSAAGGWRCVCCTRQHREVAEASVGSAYVCARVGIGDSFHVVIYCCGHNVV